MTTEQSPTLTGFLVRGADDALYFIPEEALAAFRLPAEAAEQVRQALAQQDDTQGLRYPPSGIPGPIALTPIQMPRFLNEVATKPSSSSSSSGQEAGTSIVKNAM